MATSAYARLLKVMQKEAAKLPHSHMTIAEVDENLCIDYDGILLEPDDYISLTGAVKANTEVGVYREGEEYYVISAQQDMKKELLDLFHPVGEYFYTSDINFDPNTSWSGIWEKITDGRVLVAADGNNGADPTFGNRASGGEEKVTLSVYEMPSHTHGKSGAVANGISGGSHSHSMGGEDWSSGTGSNAAYTKSANRNAQYKRTSTDSHTHNLPAHEHDSAGGGQAHNNMQPWTAAICWHRIA